MLKRYIRKFMYKGCVIYLFVYNQTILIYAYMRYCYIMYIDSRVFFICVQFHLRVLFDNYTKDNTFVLYSFYFYFSKVLVYKRYVNKYKVITEDNCILFRYSASDRKA